MPSCLTLSNIRYVSRVKWSNPGKGVVPSPIPRCRSYWRGNLLVALDYGRQLYFTYIYIYICLSTWYPKSYIYIMRKWDNERNGWEGGTYLHRKYTSQTIWVLTKVAYVHLLLKGMNLIFFAFSLISWYDCIKKHLLKKCKCKHRIYMSPLPQGIK